MTDPSPSRSGPPDLEGLSAACNRAGISVHVGTRRWDVVLSRPERRNVQTPQTWRALSLVGDAVAAHRPDVVVLRALGPSFSAGLDRAMFTGAITGTGTGSGPDEPGLPQLAALDDDELDRVIAGFQQGFTWWREVDAVTIAAVQGHAVGAGFQLALACDLRVVADDVQLAMRETSLGLVPDLAGTAPLVEAVGYSLALEICATGRPVGAQEAVTRGLAGRQVAPERLTDAVDELVEALLAAPAGAVGATKTLLRGAAGRGVAQQRELERRLQAGRLRRLAEDLQRTGR